MVADEFELVEPSLLDSGVHQGEAGLRRWFGGMSQAWSEMRWTPEELLEEGDWVVARVTFSSTGRQTGIRQAATRFQTIRVEAGRIVFATGYGKLERAMAAIGATRSDG